MEKNLKQAVIDKVYQHSRHTGLPVQCIIDDTISSKTRPSSRAVHPMEAASDHMSHLKRQMDYGHQAIGVMLACREMILNYAIILYDKTQSKIDLVCRIAAELLIPPSPGYLLCDSWYTCEKVVDMFISKGFHTISGLKTNRILYPCGIRVQLSKYAQALRKEDIGVHKVTVGKRKYCVGLSMMCSTLLAFDVHSALPLLHGYRSTALFFRRIPLKCAAYSVYLRLW